MRIISDRQISTRTFGEWSMAFRGAPRDRRAAYDPFAANSGRFSHIRPGLAYRLATTFFSLHS
jgi:hypothetical protein